MKTNLYLGRYLTGVSAFVFNLANGIVAPNLTGCVVTVVVAWLSDHFKERGFFLCLGLSLTMIGYIMTGVMDPYTQTGACYAGMPARSLTISLATSISRPIDSHVSRNFLFVKRHVYPIEPCP